MVFPQNLRHAKPPATSQVEKKKDNRKEKPTRRERKSHGEWIEEREKHKMTKKRVFIGIKWLLIGEAIESFYNNWRS